MLFLLLACQDYNLTNQGAHDGKYNPPDLAVETREDRITQLPVPSVDVLWVIDNSCSMEEEQSALRSNFGSFMQYFTDSGMDYHVGVVSTDMDNRSERGRLIRDGTSGDRFIDTTYDSATAIGSFRTRASLGTDGSSDERGKDAAFAALVTERDVSNVGFYRDDAALSIIVISDEPDYSRVEVDEFTNWMRTLKLDANLVSFSSIVGPVPGGCSTAEAGVGYVEVTRAVGGIEWPVCTSDWSGLLTELGLQAAGLKREFFLSLVPVESTLAVSVLPRGGGTPQLFELGGDFTYDRARNSITFLDYVPEPLAEVRVTYEVLASSSAPNDLGDTGEAR